MPTISALLRRPLGLTALTLIIFWGYNSLPAEEFGYEIRGAKENPSGIFLQTQGKQYVLLGPTIKTEGYLAYFAAQDFTRNIEMVPRKIEEVKVIKDDAATKGLKVTISLVDQNNQLVKDYSLLVCLEVDKKYPCLVVYSKLVYLGSEAISAGFNWGFSDHFKYYVYPEEGKVTARKLETSGALKTQVTKVGKGAYPWIWLTGGKGNGLGISALGMFTKAELEGEMQVALSAAPPTKELSKGESMGVAFILLPTTKQEGAYKRVISFYEEIKRVRWELEKW